MVKEWPEMMKEANAAIGEIGEMNPVEKEQVLALFRMIQASIKELEGANTKEEMQAKVGAVMMQFMGGM